jgi:hypothetical protein
VWITANHPLVDGHPLLTENDWKAAVKLLLFLEQFYDSTVVLSGVYYPTSLLIMHHVVEIAGHLNTYKRDGDLRNVAAPMKEQFEDYSLTTGCILFAEGLRHSAKAQKPSAKPLPSAALGKELSAKKQTAKRLFAEGHLSGTRQKICRVPKAALGKQKRLSTALFR